MGCSFPIAKTGDCLRIYEKILDITGTAYSANDNTGLLMEISDATNEAEGTGVIESVEIYEFCAAAETLQKAGFNFYFQKTTFDSGADNAAFNLVTPDATMDVIGVTGTVVTGDYVEVPGVDQYAVARKTVGITFVNRVDTTIYARLFTQGTPTYAVSGSQRLMIRIIIRRN